MPVNSLIDLFVPTLDAHDASVSVAMAGLDSGVLAFSDLDALEAFESSGPTPMHAGLHVEVEGAALLILLPTSNSEAYAPLLELLEIESVIEAVQRQNGCTIVAGGRMNGQNVRSNPPRELPSRAARVVHMVWSSLLARDLTFEDAALTGQRLLGGTGPEGNLEAVGQYATLLPVDPNDRGALIAALNGGLGIGVERALNEPQALKPELKKRRRRRRRKRSEKGTQEDNSAGNAGQD